MKDADTIQVSKIMIINYNQGKVLLLKSKRLQKFHLPGGHLQKGESFSQAIRREVKEETNLDLTSNMRVFFSKPNFKLYIGEAYPNTVKISEEHDGYVWAKIEYVHTYRLCNYTIKDMWDLQRYWKKYIKQKENRKHSFEKQFESNT